MGYTDHCTLNENLSLGASRGHRLEPKKTKSSSENDAMTDLESYLKAENEQLNEQLNVALQQAAIDQVAFDQLVAAFDQLSESHDRMVEAYDMSNEAYDRMVEAHDLSNATYDLLIAENDQLRLNSKTKSFWNR